MTDAHDEHEQDDDRPEPAALRFLTPEEVAEALRVEPEAVIDLVETYELPAIQVGEGGPWRIERNVLEQYIDDRYEAQRREARSGLPGGDDLAELWGPRIPEDG